MSSEQPIKCLCSEEGYTSDCPYVFVQNGQVYHTLNGETKLKPRRYGSEEGTSSKSDNSPGAPKSVQTGPWNSVPDYDGVLESLNTGVASFRSAIPNVEDVLHTEDAVLNRFKALKIGGEKLTDFAIGGYTLDVERAAEKARMIAPLPPARLPRIFAHGEMNFNHHLFQGLERLLGREVLLGIVAAGRYDDKSVKKLIPLIIPIVESGYEPSDNYITVFTKVVLQSTFDRDSKGDKSATGEKLIVSANLWGLQYLESMMICTEGDLQMWLSVQYAHFKNLWFNTFKDSGIPNFAVEGVQTRYIKRVYPEFGSPKYAAMNKDGEVLAWEDTDEERPKRHPKRRENRRRDTTEMLINMEKEKKAAPRRFF